jgi:hypothetical protein
MPRLSYPKNMNVNPGRVASARVKEDLPEAQSHSIRLVDQEGDKHPELEGKVQQPEVVATPPEDNASIAFQKQIDDLRKAEQLQRDRNAQLEMDREAAIKRANEREIEISRLKKTTTESRMDSIDNALAAARAEADAAQGDIEKASELGDHKGLAEAYKRLSRAEVNSANLEHGKSELEEQIKAEAIVQPEPQNPLAKFPPLARRWIEDHQYILNDPRKNAKLQSLHFDAIDAGHEEYTQPYLDFIEVGLGMRQREQAINDRDDEPQQRNMSSVVSAPPSREVPFSTPGERPGRVNLSVAQKEAAKIAGISEKDYAEQLLKLRAEKMNGNYPGGQS